MYDGRSSHLPISGVRELELVRLVPKGDVAACGLQVAPDFAVGRTVVEDGLQIAATVHAADELRAREAAHVDLARPDCHHARARRADVVVLVALATQLPERRCAVVDRRTSIGRLAHGLGLVRARARC